MERTLVNYRVLFEKLGIAYGLARENPCDLDGYCSGNYCDKFDECNKMMGEDF
ncbi:MAG: hypothetical protein ACTSRU_01790 [Candidatus Hodarchaeales archaeon]